MSKSKVKGISGGKKRTEVERARDYEVVAGKGGKKALDTTGAEAVGSNQSPATPEAEQETPATPPASTTQEKDTMTITLTRSKAARKDPRLVIYNLGDRPGSVQFLSTLFGGSKDSLGNPPETITISGDFVEPKAAREKIVETKEERKARLAALPKKTLAEKVAAAEERTAKLREKLAKAAGAPAAQ